MSPCSLNGLAVFIAFLSIGWLVADGRFTVFKCCQEGEAFMRDLNCLPANKSDDGKPRKFKVPKVVNKSGAVGFYNEDEFNLIYGMKITKASQTFFPKKRSLQNFNISEKGYLNTLSGQFTLENVTYCFDEKYENETYFYIAVDVPDIQVPCFPGDLREHCECVPGIYSKKCPPPAPASFTLYSMAISSLFLLITFIVYAVNNELQNLHGKSLLCHVASLFFAYIFVILNELRTSYILNLDNSYIRIAYILQFSFIATFFWLNVMCFETWRKFRYPSVTTNEYENKKFIIYSIYAWGCSIIISIVTFVADNYTSLHPVFSSERYWFDSREAEKWFFYFPAGILLFSNLLMFIHTIYMVIYQRPYEKVFNPSQKRRENEKREISKLKLCCFLFIVMGMKWIIDVIVWAIEAPGYAWTIMSIGDAVQGFLIFIIFVCDKSVLRLLNRKFCPQIQLFGSYSVASTRNSIDNTNMSAQT